MAKVENVNKIVYCWHTKFPLFPAKAGNKLETLCASNNYSLSTGGKSTATFPDDSDVFPEDCYIFPSETRKNRQSEGKTSEFEGNKAGFRPVDT